MDSAGDAGPPHYLEALDRTWEAQRTQMGRAIHFPVQGVLMKSVRCSAERVKSRDRKKSSRSRSGGKAKGDSRKKNSRSGERGSGAEEDAKAQVLKPDEQLGGRLHETVWFGHVYRADPDPGIEDLIAELPPEAAEEVAEEVIQKVSHDQEIVEFKAKKDIEKDLLADKKGTRSKHMHDSDKQ